MDAGRLRRRIEFQNRATTLNDYNESVTGWATFATCWAGFEPVSGSERIRGGVNLATKLVKVITRYRTDLTEQMRIVYNGRAYDVLSIIDPDEHHVMLEIMCQLSPESATPAGAVTADGEVVTAGGETVTAT